MKVHTELVRFDPAPGDDAAPAVTPLYATATFHQPGATASGRFDYARSGNPTRAVLEAQLARLDRGERAFAYTSGMAAIDAAFSLVPAGGAVVAGQDLYGGAYRFLHRVLPSRGVLVRQVDSTDLGALERALAAAAAAGQGPLLVWVETPSNPRMRITDLRAAARIAHANDAWLGVDASMMSPYLMRPLELGADLVAHSATKYLCGHGNVTAGTLAVRDPDLGERLAWHQNAAGTALAPFDCWLLLNGIKTLALRLDRQQATARRLARALARRPEVAAVHYPDLDGHPGRDLHRTQADGPGAVLAVRLATPELGRALVEGTRLFAIAVSFGSVASTIELPGRMSHAPMAGTDHAHDDALVRLSVGIEDPDDLEHDLLTALDRAAALA